MTDPLHQLLEVQALDTRADQLAHRRRSSTTLAEVTAAEAEHARLDAALAAAEARAGTLGDTQERLEGEIAALEQRVAATEAKLAGGAVSAPRELQALVDEVAGLRSRVSGLEDEELVVMEELEVLATEQAALSSAAEEAAEALSARRAALAEEQAEIEGELASVAEARAAALTELPADLVARYDTIRARSGGVGVARLDGRRCTGCHLELPAREHDEVRRAPIGTVTLHEECGRILVHD